MSSMATRARTGDGAKCDEEGCPRLLGRVEDSGVVVIPVQSGRAED